MCRPKQYAEDARLVLKIDEKVFDLRGQVRQKGIFNAATGRPADLRRIAKRRPSSSRLNVGESGAASPIDQQTIPRIPDAPAHCGEPIALRFAAATAIIEVCSSNFASPSRLRCRKPTS